MTPKQKIQAKRLFMAYDGSVFYMSRDGVDDEFCSYKVPKQIITGWRKELLASKIAMINKEENWRVVHLLNHHRCFEYTDVVMRAEPKGPLNDRCIFWEEVLDYCSNLPTVQLSAPQRAALLERVLRDCDLMSRLSRSDFTRQRIERIRIQAENQVSRLRP